MQAHGSLGYKGSDHMELSNVGDHTLAVLQYLIDSGKLDLGNAEEEMKKAQLEQILLMHPFKIYQGSDGNWYTYIRDEKRPEKRKRIVKTTLKKVHEALYEHYTGNDEATKLRSYTVESLYPRWLEYKSLHTTASSYITRLKSDWRRYYEGTAIVKVPIVDLKKLQLDEWIHALIREKDVTQKQFSNFTTIMNQVLDYAVDLEIIDDNPFRKVRVDGRHLFRQERKKDSSTQVFSRDEEQELKELAWVDYQKRTKKYVLSPLAVLFQFETGVRIGELCVLRFEDVHGDYIRVQRMFRRDNREVVQHTKGSYGDRDVILTQEAKHIIDTCRTYRLEHGLPDEGYIFSVDKEPCSYYAISDLYRKYCRKMGIPMKSSHKARKTVISALIDGNVNINSVREMAGHRDERTTYANYVYDRNTAEEKVRMVEEALKK